MKVLVTGGAGFIGSNIVKHLLEKGHEVRVIDNLSSGYLINIKKLVDNKDIEFVNADIRDADAVESAVKDREVVFHLAASVGRQRSLDNPQLDSEINVIGTLNLLEAMRKNSVHRIIYSSSAALFGELIQSTISEDHPQNADSPYGVSKLAAEKMVLAYSGIYDIVGTCLRYFNIYGVNQRFDLYGNVIPIFAKRIFSGEPITIYGDGTQTRDFLNVYDVANANRLALEKSFVPDVFNMGSGSSITISALADMMIKISGRPTQIIHAPERKADVKHCKANIAKASAALGFKAQVELENGLAEYMEWYSKNCL